MLIRDFVPSDSQKIVEILKENQQYGHPELDGPDAMLRVRKCSAAEFLVAEKDLQVVGFIRGVYDGSRALIHIASVQPEYQRRGIGKALVLEISRRFTSVQGPGCLFTDGDRPGRDELLAQGQLPTHHPHHDCLPHRISHQDAGVRDRVGHAEKKIAWRSIRELILRVQSLLRRAERGPQIEDRGHFADDRLTIDVSKRLVLRDGIPVHLTRTEFAILSLLVAHRGQVIPAERILQEVWGQEISMTNARYVRVYIHHLRRKIEPDPSKPRYVLTERHLGYIFRS